MAFADVDVKLYLQMLSRTGEDSLVAEAYVTGAELALEAANAELRARHQPPLFCTPEKLALNANNYRSIIEAQTRKASKIVSAGQAEAFPVYIVLMRGLIDTFPCPTGKP